LPRCVRAACCSWLPHRPRVPQLPAAPKCDKMKANSAVGMYFKISGWANGWGDDINTRTRAAYAPRAYRALRTAHHAFALPLHCAQGAFALNNKFTRWAKPGTRLSLRGHRCLLREAGAAHFGSFCKRVTQGTRFAVNTRRTQHFGCAHCRRVRHRSYYGR